MILLSRTSTVLLAMACASASFALTYSTSFEAPTFNPGNINGQDGWSSTNPSFVANVSTAQARTGTQSFYRDNTYSTGSFGDQPYSRGIGAGVGEVGSVGHTAGYNVLRTSFWFLNTATGQDNSVISFAASDAGGSRAWSVSLDNRNAAGTALTFFGASGTNAGNISFDPTSLGTLTRGQWHRIETETSYFAGESNDLVKVWINGTLAVSAGTTWEQYYRYSPEQAGNGNQLWAVDRVLFRSSVASGGPVSGFYFDDFSMQAVPEPGTMAALGLGAAALIRRRRAKK